MKLKNNLTIKSQMQEYSSKGFYPAQLRQIRQGLEKNIDVSKYACIRYNSGVMMLLRELLTFDNEFDISDYVDDNDALDIYQLLSRHTLLAHPHSGITTFRQSEKDYLISHDPYYVKQ